MRRLRVEFRRVRWTRKDFASLADMARWAVLRHDEVADAFREAARNVLRHRRCFSHRLHGFILPSPSAGFTLKHFIGASLSRLRESERSSVVQHFLKRLNFVKTSKTR